MSGWMRCVLLFSFLKHTYLLLWPVALPNFHQPDKPLMCILLWEMTIMEEESANTIIRNRNHYVNRDAVYSTFQCLWMQTSSRKWQGVVGAMGSEQVNASSLCLPLLWGNLNIFNSRTFQTHDTFLSHKSKTMLFHKTGVYNSYNMNHECNFSTKQRHKYSSLKSNLLSQPDQKLLHGPWTKQFKYKTQSCDLLSSFLKATQSLKAPRHSSWGVRWRASKEVIS